MSDIDLLPVFADPDAAAALDRRRAELVDWWAASGRAQTLDVARADAGTAARRTAQAPGWLRERIDLSLGARAAVGSR